MRAKSKLGDINLHNVLQGESVNDIESLYINYIETLVKSENLQNKLEKMYKKISKTPNDSVKKKTAGINNNLNKLLVEVMAMQNLINYIKLR